MGIIKNKIGSIYNNTQSKDIKLQSAIEYLVTYGWAILIIAIVLFVIFNSGLLNPQKPTYCVTSSDFSCPVYNFNTSSGKLTINLYQYTSSPINITAFGCNTNKTLPEMQIPYNPRAIVYYIPITIENSQPSPTPAPFQQVVNITESNYAQYITYNSNFANFEYFYANGTVIPAWIESNNSGKLITWVNIKGGIPSSSSITIYLGFANKTANLLSSSGTSGIGEAPQLSSTYAEYDDGASVFNNYWNFAGTSVPSGMTSSGTVTINNGASVSFGGYLTTTATFTYPSNIIADFGFTAPTANAGNAWYQFGYVSQSGGYTYYPSTAIAWNVNDAPPYFVSESESGGSGVTVSTEFPSGTAPAGSFNVGTVYWGSTSSDNGWINYGSEITQTSYIPSTALYLGINNNQADGTAPPVPTLYWLRTRAYPPNGAMPSVTFGSAQSITLNIPSGIQYYVHINITNSQTSSTPSPFQQMVNITESNYAQYITYNSNFANFEYFYANGTVIPAWIESNQSGKLITWIKINPSIPASGKLTVYLGFASTSANLLSSSGTSGIGEASQLSSTYGEYDDIGSVMQPGLIYQVYYYSTGTCSSSSYQNNVYGATLGDGVTISSCASFVSSTNPFVTSQAGTTQNVDGTNQPNVVINYQEGYSGGIAYPNPPVSNNAYSWIIKTIGFADLPNQNINFYGLSDDGIAMGYNTNSGSSNGQYWLGGTSNPNNIYNGWHDQGATQYNGIVSPGTYAIEQDYYENGGGAYTALWSNITVNYYHAAYPPSGTMPSVSFGSVGNSASSAPFIVTLSPHQVTIPINSNYTLTMQCYNNGTIASVPSGQIFDGYFFVNYTSLNNGFHQTLVGDVAAKAT